MAKAHTIAVTTHGHYLEEPAEGGSPPAGLLMGFHGYGENAATHLAVLGRIPGAKRWTRCALQGLHLFYRQSTGEVVSSWMTRFEREQTIRDNVAYAGAVLSQLKSQQAAPTPRVLAGFSQGVAMVYRTAAFAGHSVDGLIVLAGDVPPDLEDADLARLPPILLGQGEGDKWYNTAKLDADLARLKAAGVSVEVCRFAGGHEWADPFLEVVGEFLGKLATPGPLP